MKIIYVHGLDSSSNSLKGQLLQQYCEEHCPDIMIVRPDLNQPPDVVLEKLCSDVELELKNNRKVMLVGSSLGGYFSSLVSNITECPTLLLNPSTQPHISLRRFGNDSDSYNNLDKEEQGSVLYHTKGGWALTPKDLNWFAAHKLTRINYPKQIYVIIKAGDELLDPSIAENFYRSQGVTVSLQQGGDHRMSDFAEQLPEIMTHIQSII